MTAQIFRTSCRVIQAAVHAGWATGLAHMAPDMVRRIKDIYAQKGIKHFIIMGHSQGGALTFLATSYLYYLREKGELPGDIRFKSYCSAAPQPGNIYYAWDFDFITRNGAAFTVVNAADWYLKHRIRSRHSAITMRVTLSPT